MKKLIQFVLISCLLVLSSGYASAVQYETEQDIIMIGDVHGAYDEMLSILQHAELVDEQLNWIGKQKHFVSTGDLMDRGPSSRKIMDLLIKLQKQAENAGGKVHVLLGNHEVLNLVGDWRYISKAEYAEFLPEETQQMREAYFKKHNSIASKRPLDIDSFNKQFPPGFFARLEAFMPDGEYGKWLHELPFVIKINDHIFTHGGLSVKTHNDSISELNEALKDELEQYTGAWVKLISEEQLAPSTDYGQRFSQLAPLRQTRVVKRFLKSTNGLVFSPDSPNWYRGNAMCHPLFETQVLQQALDNYKGKVLWVGHTTDRTVRQRFDQRLVLMDTGMLKSAYNGQAIYARIIGGSALPQDWRFMNAESGAVINPETPANRRSINPHGMSDAEVEDFLKTANVVSTKRIGEGITNPLRVSLEKGGVEIEAVFKYYDSGNSRQTLEKGNSDRYQYEVAAYKLDRMMGMNLVPVAVERKIARDKGALQLWVDGLINYRTMQEDNVKYDGFCNYARQRQMLDVFDYLIHNADRNQSNIAFTQSDWQLWFIDHTRSFRTSTRRPKLLRRTDLSLTPAFRKTLELLDKDKLDSLSPWLTRRQIGSILKRRDRLLNGKA